MPPVTPSPFRFITKPSQKPKSPDSTTSNPTSSSITLYLPSPPPASASTPTPTPKPTAAPKPQFAPAKRFHIPTPRTLLAPTPPPPPPPPVTQPSRAQTPNSASPPFLSTARRFHIPPSAQASTPAPARARFSYAPSGSGSTQPTTPAPPRTTLLFKKSYQRDSVDADVHSEEPTSPLQKKRRLHSGGEDIENASSPPPSPHESDTEEPQEEKPRNRFLFTPTTTAVAAQSHTIASYHRSIRPPPGRGAGEWGGGRGGEEAIPLDWSPVKTRAAKRWTAGGLAAEVAGWVLEKSSLSVHAGGGGRVVVAGVKSGDGVFAVKGEGEGEGSFLLPIVGGGGIDGGLAVGSLVVYGLPWWEVLVDGVKFRFLVAWRVEEGEGEEIR
ncbi:hypothetical protein HOY80DRAFT_749872 [Tuber brumale]|nr:hypothetical protein HOY80DRAFT_749872 [Tuber brumale]